MASSSLLTAFDEGGTRFALVTPDGRIKSYDTVTGRLRTSIAAGPAEAHLCAAWLPAAAASGGGNKGANAAAGSSSSSTVLAVGTASGDVAAYDTATAELRWRAAGVNDGGVSCLAAAAGAPGAGGKRAASSSSSAPPRLVTCGADAMVVSLDAQTGEPAPFSAPPRQNQHGADGPQANGHAAAAPASFRGSKHPVTAAALSRDGGRALVGATTLALWELSPAGQHKPRRLAKLTGHPLPVRAAVFAPGAGHHALTAARGERGVSVWRASAEALDLPSAAAAGASPGGKRKSSDGVVAAAAANLAMDDEAVQLSTCAAGGPAGAFFAAAVGEAGECVVWRVAPTGASASAALEVVPQARVRVAGAASGGETILAAHLEPTAGEGVTLLVVRGSPAAPAFERVHIALRAPGAAGAAPVLELAPAPGGGLLPATRPAAVGAGGKARAGPADVLGPDNAGAMVRSRAPAEDDDDDSSEEEEDDNDEEEPASPGVPSPPRRKRGAPADEEEDDEEADEDDEDEDEGQTLGARLAALDQQQQPAATGAAAGARRGGAAASTSAAAASKPPPLLAGVRGAAAKADSLAVMLTQALRSGDRALLERCLSVSDPRVVSNTARRLVPVDAAALLRAGVERLQSSPRRAASLAAWIRAALVHHAAYLTGAPGAQPVMASLYRTIESRLAAQRALLSLAGRLDLLLAASAASASASASSAAAAGASAGAARAAPLADDGPRVVYQESEDEEEEVEDAFARVGLEGTDDEDDEDEDDDGGDGGSSDDDLLDGMVGGGGDSDAEDEDDSMLDDDEDEDEEEDEEDDEDDDVDDDDDDEEEDEDDE